ncbi:MAG: DUF59 domain-containing protein [Anaerolineae bacterium]|nr:DUF59 domain-containing protein [Anaerolineae bacterium]
MTKGGLRRALRPAVDPETEMNMVGIRVVRNTELDDEGKIEVQRVLTAPFCPIEGLIAAPAPQAMAAVPGVAVAKTAQLDEP